MKNFDYLKEIEPLADLYSFCNAAEETQQTDYDNCASNCRKALEWMTKTIYKLKHVEIPERANLYELTTGKPFLDLVNDEQLLMKTHYIRKVGNTAVHSGGVTKREAFFTLLNTYDLIGDILVQLGVIKSLKPFDKELIPNKPALHIEPSDNIPSPSEDFIKSVPEETIKHPVKVDSKSANITEDETRKLYIDLLLREAGWEVMDKENTPFAKKAGIEIEVQGMPNAHGVGYCDYVLYGKDGKPLAVIEAKRTSVDVKKGKHQAELYADCLEKQYGIRPVIYYTNGFHTNIIDGLGYPPRPVFGFHNINDLELMMSQRGRKPITDLQINENITNRYYQKNAIRAVCDHFNGMHRHALIVMATGTGKTRVAISLCDVLLRNHWVKNILFLADRTSLVNQAYENFSILLPEYSFCNLSNMGPNDSKSARIMFSTYQTMINYIDAEEKEFSVGRFDLIILDEAHRSIFGKYMSIFNYFDSFLVGLTATPRDEVERSTYDLFHLESGEPNYTYSQEEAEKDGYLVGYVPISKTTRRLRDGIQYDSLTEDEKEQLDKAWEYEKAKKEMQTGIPQQKTPRDIEKREMFEFIYNINTVDIVLQSLMEEGLKINYGDKIGKSIIFAYDHDHAQMIVDRFYALYPNLDPNFCQLVDYSVKYAQNIIDNFKIREKMPQIAVSVDMLDTGIDVPDILNLVFFKPVYSKIKYIQMIGRGTRLSENIFADGTDKKEFYIFDWCENFEFFRDHREGFKQSPSMSLSERLFGLMLDVSVALQHQKYQQDDFAKSFCQKLKDLLFEQVSMLSESIISVRNVWACVEKYKNKDNWTYLSELDALEMKQKLAPLIIPDPEDTGNRMFDALMLNIMLERLVPDNNAVSSKNKVIQIGQRLQTKASIPEVQKRMSLIQDIMNPVFLNTAPLSKLEQTRMELRDIIYVVLGSYHERFFVNISDTLEPKDPVEKVKLQTDYHTRILDYLNAHRDIVSIQKIYNLQQLTNEDIMELETICWKELGSKEEYDKYVEKGQMICGDKVAAFIRSIVGINRTVAKERFSSFLNDNVLNVLQEEYLNQIIGYVCLNGDIQRETLMKDENLKTLNWAGVFGTKLINVGNYVAELHEVVQVANGETAGGYQAKAPMAAGTKATRFSKAKTVKMKPEGTCINAVTDDPDILRLVENMMALDEGTTILQISVECQKQFNEQYFNTSPKEWLHLVGEYVRAATQRPELKNDETFRYEIA